MNGPGTKQTKLEFFRKTRLPQIAAEISILIHLHRYFGGAYDFYGNGGTKVNLNGRSWSATIVNSIFGI